MKAYVCSRKYKGSMGRLDYCPMITAYLSYKVPSIDPDRQPGYPSANILWAMGKYNGQAFPPPADGHFEPVMSRSWSRKPNRYFVNSPYLLWAPCDLEFLETLG